MKNKLLALILSVSLVASLFSCIPMNAFAANSDLTPSGKNALSGSFEGSAAWYSATNGESDAKFIQETLPTEGSVLLNGNIQAEAKSYTDYKKTGTYTIADSKLGEFLLQNETTNDSATSKGDTQYDRLYSAQRLEQDLTTYEITSEVNSSDNKTYYTRGELVSANVITSTIISNRNSQFKYASGSNFYGYDSEGAYYATKGGTKKRPSTDAETPYAFEQLIYDLGSGARVTDIMFGGQYTTAALRPSNYQIFVSNTSSNLFDDGNLLYHFINDNGKVNTAIQHYKLTKGAKARYVGIRLLNPTCGDPTNSNFANAQNRISVLQIYGNIVPSATFTSDDTRSYGTIDTTTTLFDKELSSFEIVQYNTNNNTVRSRSTVSNDSAVITEATDADCTHADFKTTNGCPYNLDDASGKYYYDIIWDIGYKAILSDIILLNGNLTGTNANRRLADTAIYAMNDLSELGSDSALLGRYTLSSGNAKLRHHVTFEGGFTARYIVFRIYNIGSATSSRYARIEFNAFGTAAEEIVPPVIEHNVTFYDNKEVPVYTTTVIDGETAAAAAEAAEAALASNNGYTFLGWSGDTEAAITADTDFTAVYERDISTTYSLEINGESSETLAFDSKITLNAREKVLWKVNGQKFSIGNSAIAYAFGNIEITSEDASALDENEPFVSLLHTVKDVEGGQFIAFIRLYDPNGEATEFGASFWNALQETPSKFKTVAFNAGNDAMATLYGIPEGASRAVKAYAIIGEETICSELIDTAQF